MLKIALICGGPSLERGISLNSARSVMDHLSNSQIEIIPLYVDRHLNFYLISCGQLYSNTPSDFDFKLDTLAKKIPSSDLPGFFETIDLVFPVVHGTFGEDGDLQQLLEECRVPYIGSNSESCQQMFNKYQVAKILKENHFTTLPSLLIEAQMLGKKDQIHRFFETHQLERAIVKPVKSGSSIGVFSVSTSDEVEKKCEEIFQRHIDNQVIIEPFCIGQEFTIIVMQNQEQQPIALLPTQIDMDYADHQILDYRRKYLPTNQVAYHTPPKFDLSLVDQIRREAEQIFTLFKMRDFVRLDGWVLANGQVCFTDINPISGLEQNSFLFRQTSIVGMTHQQTLHYIIKGACFRAGLTFREETISQNKAKKSVYVLFGNSNAERQVSLMSGTNVWLKLLQSDHVNPIPCLYDYEGHIWQLPYSYTLNHTVEEIYQNCKITQEELNKFDLTIQTICRQLKIPAFASILPKEQTCEEFLSTVRDEKAFVFIAMHGREGEDGTLQKKMEQYRIPYNGSSSKVSAICMDKFLTGNVINELSNSDILSLPKVRLNFNHLKNSQDATFINLWNELCEYLHTSKMIIKPRADGCSAGIVFLTCANDLKTYFEFLQNHASFIPANTFAYQNGPIDLPASFQEQEFLVEPYIQTDSIRIIDKVLTHVPLNGWIELTVGVLENQNHYTAFNPSITVAEGAVLSLEEKFQGGTGINLTPPPESIISAQALEKIKQMVQKTAQALNIQNYARLDIFYNCHTGKMILIEVNSLPALTPSTVLYHQALTESPSLPPKQLLEKLIYSQLSAFEKLNV